MATDVIMPQMGESIFEGTLTKWLKKPGDRVERDEPLFEISTDKVDAEIPSPAAGVLGELKVQEGATVQINTVVAVIGDSSEAEGAAPAPTKHAPAADVAEQAHAEPEAGGGASDVLMPQMGESILEGTITKWLKQVGDKVERDEPLFEISTDKVDAEIPSPAAGVLAAIEVEAGATVQINTVVARIGGSAQGSARPAQPSAVPSAPTDPDSRKRDMEPEAQSGERLRTSPLVRKMAKEHELDLNKVVGSGSAGRITKEDVLSYIDSKGAGESASVPSGKVEKVSDPLPVAPSVEPIPIKPVAPATTVQAGQVVPMTRMRSIIAQRMVESKRTNAHVHTVFKIDLTRIVRLREKERAKYEQRNGVKLTYMPFLSRAVIATLRKMPIINASIEGDAIRYHANVNLGIAVALDWGLIVPVIKQAEERSFLGIARAIVDVAERARGKKLKPDEVGTSTFTLTNAGIYGEQFGTPVINMPESAILGIGGLFKEPAVITDEAGNDSIAIRHMIHLTLGFDHRIIDGADAGKFMAEVKKYLEGWSEAID